MLRYNTGGQAHEALLQIHLAQFLDAGVEELALVGVGLLDQFLGEIGAGDERIAQDPGQPVELVALVQPGPDGAGFVARGEYPGNRRGGASYRRGVG